MGRALFGAFVVILGAAEFVSAYGAVLYGRLFKKARRGVDLALTLMLLGMIITQGVLLLAIIPEAVVDPNPDAVFFLLGTTIQALGALSLVRRAILISAELDEHVLKSPQPNGEVVADAENLKDEQEKREA